METVTICAWCIIAVPWLTEAIRDCLHHHSIQLLWRWCTAWANLTKHNKANRYQSILNILSLLHWVWATYSSPNETTPSATQAWPSPQLLSGVYDNLPCTVASSQAQTFKQSKYNQLKQCKQRHCGFLYDTSQEVATVPSLHKDRLPQVILKVISPSPFSFSFSFSTANETTNLLFSSKYQVKMPDSYNVKSSGTNSQVWLYTHFIRCTTDTNPGQPLLLSGLRFQCLQLQLLPLLQHVSCNWEWSTQMVDLVQGWFLLLLQSQRQHLPQQWTGRLNLHRS